METYWETLRDAEFPVARNWAYLDHAAVAPLPRRSSLAIRAWADDQAERGAVDWPSWERKVEALRDGLAAWIGADRDEIAFASSTTHGIGLVAEATSADASGRPQNPRPIAKSIPGIASAAG